MDKLNGIGSYYFRLKKWGMNRGTFSWYSAYFGYFEAEISSEKLALPLKRRSSKIAPPIDQLNH
jgi:hypothetical protein